MNDEREAGEEPGVDLGGLPREAVPPPHLEDKLVRELRGRAMLRSRKRWPITAFAVAASVLLFAVGLVAGRSLPRRAAPHGTQFVLLLYRGAEPVWSPEEVRQRVGEVIGWVRAVRADGRVLDGEKLGDQQTKLGEPDVAVTGASELQGFFVLEAASLADAESVARTCPHLRYGGVIVVKPIART